MKEKKNLFFQGNNKVFWFIPTQNKNKPKTNHNNNQGGLKGQVRWPKGPPHLTLKPFQEKTKEKIKEQTKPNNLNTTNKNKPKTKQIRRV